MNNTCPVDNQLNPSWDQICTLILTALTLLVNLHQSYSHNHHKTILKSECCSILIDNEISDQSADT